MRVCCWTLPKCFPWQEITEAHKQAAIKLRMERGVDLNVWTVEEWKEHKQDEKLFATVAAALNQMNEQEEKYHGKDSGGVGEEGNGDETTGQ